MARATKSDIYIATESGTTEIDGESYVYIKGATRIRGGHALLKVVPDYFEPVGDHVHYDSETASTTPGGTRED